MGYEHTEIYEVKVGKKLYYLSTSAKHKLISTLSNYGIKYDSLRKTRRKIEQYGGRVYFKNSLERALTTTELNILLKLK